MHNYNEQIIKNGSGRMKRPPLAKNSKAEEVQFLRSSIPLCFCVHIPAPILFWCRYPLVCGYFVALLSGIFIDIGPCNKHFSKSNQRSHHTISPKRSICWRKSNISEFTRHKTSQVSNILLICHRVIVMACVRCPVQATVQMNVKV